MHARGMCHEDDKEASKENGQGSQPDILKYLGNYSFETKAITRLLYSRTWEIQGSLISSVHPGVDILATKINLEKF